MRSLMFLVTSLQERKESIRSRSLSQLLRPSPSITLRLVTIILVRLLMWLSRLMAKAWENSSGLSLMVKGQMVICKFLMKRLISILSRLLNRKRWALRLRILLIARFSSISVSKITTITTHIHHHKPNSAMCSIWASSKEPSQQTHKSKFTSHSIQHKWQTTTWNFW